MVIIPAGDDATRVRARAINGAAHQCRRTSVSRALHISAARDTHARMQIAEGVCVYVGVGECSINALHAHLVSALIRDRETQTKNAEA